MSHPNCKLIHRLSCQIQKLSVKLGKAQAKYVSLKAHVNNNATTKQQIKAQLRVCAKLADVAARITRLQAKHKNASLAYEEAARTTYGVKMPRRLTRIDRDRLALFMMMQRTLHAYIVSGYARNSNMSAEELCANFAYGSETGDKFREHILRVVHMDTSRITAELLPGDCLVRVNAIGVRRIYHTPFTPSPLHAEDELGFSCDFTEARALEVCCGIPVTGYVYRLVAKLRKQDDAFDDLLKRVGVNLVHHKDVFGSYEQLCSTSPHSFVLQAYSTVADNSVEVIDTLRKLRIGSHKLLRSSNRRIEASRLTRTCKTRIANNAIRQADGFVSTEQPEQPAGFPFASPHGSGRLHVSS